MRVNKHTQMHAREDKGNASNLKQPSIPRTGPHLSGQLPVAVLELVHLNRSYRPLLPHNNGEDVSLANHQTNTALLPQHKCSNAPLALGYMPMTTKRAEQGIHLVS